MISGLVLLLLSTSPPAPVPRIDLELKVPIAQKPPPRFVQRSVKGRYVENGTPLVISFASGAPVKAIADDQTFELEPGRPMYSVWPSADTPWLCRDLNHDGNIDSGRELFGSFTLTGHGLARDGFEALAELDQNRDAVIDAHDPLFFELSLWRDLDGNRRVDPGELTAAADSGIKSIALSYTLRRRCGPGFCEIERAPVELTHGAGEVIDLRLELSAEAFRPSARASAPRSSTSSR
jgi:hypothetical protein